MEYDLVFEGGGAKGMAFVGALREFEAQGHTSGRLLGTSAGAITATLLAAGFDAAEMLAALNEKKDGQPVFASFMGAPSELDAEALQQSATRVLLRQLDVPLLPEFIEERVDDQIVKTLNSQPRLRHIFSLVEYGGWFSARSFLTWLEAKLNSGLYQGTPRHFGGLSLAEFYQATRVELSLVASDTAAHRLLVLNHRTAPDCPLVWAVRMSMNIPFLWQEVLWQAAWGQYRGQNISGHPVVDGGMLSNFPMELFVSELPAITAIMGPRTEGQLLGFLIDETLPVAGAEVVVEPHTKQFSVGSLHTVQRIEQLLDTMMQAHDKLVVEAFEKLVVRLPAQGYGTTEFDMSVERKNLLVAAGERSMRQYHVQQKEREAQIPFALEVVGADDTQRWADRIAQRLLR
ncbi:MAG: patatin-like phospholipase family protein [Chloroflexota bacterium]|nr:patatin-like phospholipase family protein [Chloroflexota bacterium]